MKRPIASSAVLGAAVLLGSSQTACRDATLITLEIYATDCARLHVAVVVGRPGEIDSKAPTAFKKGCETPGGVGTLTLFPSGEDDAEVAIAVIGGVDLPPDLCRAPQYAGCIVRKRVTRFVPHTEVRIKVTLSATCLNIACPGGTTCDNGVCASITEVGARDTAVLAEGGLP